MLAFSPLRVFCSLISANLICSISLKANHEPLYIINQSEFVIEDWD